MHSLKDELASRTNEVEELRLEKGTEVSALQATVRQLQGEVEESSKRHSELQLIEVCHSHSLFDDIIELFVFFVLFL